ncbi:MAG: YegS/Rv2252/BmrU family lipid kinase [Ruminococcaceae bacterium]|nr:YegS/Rv2252/BmrU family lipid kinase [Oscillospiraceae bacterium]
MKKLLIIMNPCSGKKKANGKLAEIISTFNRGGYDVTTYMTAARGDATVVAHERAAEFDLIVCIGGDGTFNEVISGIYDLQTKPPIGYIPAGSTNDFANSLKLSKNILGAAKDIVEGSIRPLDIGRFNNRYFSYIASFGAFTKTSYATPQSLKNVLGHLAYVLASVKELASIRSHHLRFTLKDGTVYEDDYIFGAISNSTSVAGILTLAPDLVDMSDGLFELLLIRKPHTLLELSDCVLALMTQEYSTAMLTLVSTESVSIEAPADMSWTLDGEYAEGAANCTATNLHNAVNIITNVK